MLKAHTISLRALEQSDLPARVRWINDPDINQTLMFDFPTSLAKTEQWFKAGLLSEKKRHFSIVCNETDKLIGMTGLLDIDRTHRRAQFYITIGESEFWGKGIASEVIPLVLDYAFVELNLVRVYLYTLDSNARARSVYEKNGFRTDGKLRDHYYCRGQQQNLTVQSILRAEWMDRKSGRAK